MRLMIERALNNYILCFHELHLGLCVVDGNARVHATYRMPGEEQDCKSSGNAPMIGQFFCHHRSHLLQAVSALGPNLHYDDELDKNNSSRKFPRWFETKVMHLKDHVERPEKNLKLARMHDRGSSNYENSNLGTISSRLTF